MQHLLDSRISARSISMQCFKAIDLFCGTGGFSRGAHMSGFEVVAAYDRDPKLTHSFQTNFPDTKLFLKDISKLTGEEVFEDARSQSIDLVFGGPPCQGFSSIGRRAVDDPRRTLLGHFFRLVSEIKPSVFVMENVEGLLYENSIHELLDAMGKMEGYTLLDPKVLDAAEFGAATKRRRAFVVGYIADQCAAMDWDSFETMKKPAATVQQALSGLSKPRLAAETDDGFDAWKLSRGAKLSAYASDLAARDRKFTGNQQTRHTPPVIQRFSAIKPGGFDKVGRYPRLSWSGQCPTLRAGTGADKGSYQAVRPIHPTQNRVITVREAARLQGFPDNHRFHPTTWHSFRQIGNSVSPIMGAAIFRVIESKLSSTRHLAEAAE